MMAAADWSLPPVDNLAAIAPLFPTSDLIYNDLTGIPQQGMMAVPMDGDDASLGTGGVLPWQFEGDFGEDTVWQILNQFQSQEA